MSQDSNYSTRQCPCGRNKLLKQYNPVVDGVQKCLDCKIESLYARKGVEA